MKRMLLLVTLSCTLFGGMPHALAVNSADVQLTITPRLCVIDVIQDGTNQTLHTPSPGCEAALPNLVPVTGHPVRGPLVALPFAGSPEITPLLLPRVGAVWSPIVSKEHDGPTTSSSAYLSWGTTGLAAAAIAIAIGIDLALFEMHYARSILRWARRFSISQVIKK